MVSLEAEIHRDIPIAAQMGVSVVSASAEHVMLHAPLGPNTNHKNTAFGGSV